MTREKEIEKASAHRFDEWGEQAHAFELAFQAGAMWADAHPAWISVEDALPPLNGYFLFYGKIGEARIMDCHTVHHGKSDEQYLSDCIEDGSITHWMPLLAPPHHFPDVNKMVKKGGEE